MSYPPSVDVSVARNECVPAYAAPVRLVQDLAIVVNGEMRQLAQKPGSKVTSQGTLAYQACTQTTCDPPQEVPLSWTVVLKPLD